MELYRSVSSICRISFRIFRKLHATYVKIHKVGSSFNRNMFGPLHPGFKEPPIAYIAQQPDTADPTGIAGKKYFRAHARRQQADSLEILRSQGVAESTGNHHPVYGRRPGTGLVYKDLYRRPNGAFGHLHLAHIILGKIDVVLDMKRGLFV